MRKTPGPRHTKTSQFLKRLGNGKWKKKCQGCDRWFITDDTTDYIQCRPCQRECAAEVGHEPDDDDKLGCFRCGGRIKDGDLAMEAMRDEALGEVFDAMANLGDALGRAISLYE